MATASTSFALSVTERSWEQEQIRGAVRGGRSGDVTASRTNCRSWRNGSGVCRLTFRHQTNPRGWGGDGARFVAVRKSQFQVRGIVAYSSLDDGYEEDSESDSSSGESSCTEEEDDSGKTVQIDLQLPRRRLLVEFTCNLCQTRTQRLVNPDAYKRGTVYVQCGGCEKYHQLVDNLGLVVEYDFRKEEAESNSSQSLES